MARLIPRRLVDRPVSPADAASFDRRVRSPFPAWVPSPVKEILWIKKLHGHVGARVILFDDVPCLIIMEGPAGSRGEVRWVYRGLVGYDTRSFFYHRMRASWMRTDGTREEAMERHRLNFV